MNQQDIPLNGSSSLSREEKEKVLLVIAGHLTGLDRPNEPADFVKLEEKALEDEKFSTSFSGLSEEELEGLLATLLEGLWGN